MKRLNYYDVSIYQIQLFLEIAKERNFSKVSEKMNIAQPALSKKMSALEKTLGFTLFERSSRPVSLTSVGEYLYTQWSALLQNYEISIENACDIGENSENSFTVGCLDSLDMKYSIAVYKFFREHPEVDGHIEFCQFSAMWKMLMDGRLDVIFWPCTSKDNFGPGICRFELVSSPMLVCMLKSNTLALKGKVHIGDLKNQKFILISPGEKSDSYVRIAEICQKEGFSPQIARYVPNAHSLIVSLRKDDEIVLCDHFLVGIDNPNVQCVELEGVSSTMDIVWKQDNENPYINEFIKEIQSIDN